MLDYNVYFSETVYGKVQTSFWRLSHLPVSTNLLDIKFMFLLEPLARPWEAGFLKAGVSMTHFSEKGEQSPLLSLNAPLRGKAVLLWNVFKVTAGAKTCLVVEERRYSR